MSTYVLHCIVVDRHVDADGVSGITDTLRDEVRPLNPYLL